MQVVTALQCNALILSVNNRRQGIDPAVMKHERAQRAGGHVPDVPDGAAEILSDEAEELIPQFLGRTGTADDVESREDGLGGDGTGAGPHDVLAGAEEVEQHAGEDGVLVVAESCGPAIPAGVDGGFALVCAEEAVDETAEEEQAAVADGPAVTC
jgi:hypothetical protein